MKCATSLIIVIPVPLFKCIINNGVVNAMPNVLQALLQYVTVTLIHPRLTNTLLDDAHIF